MSRKCSVEGCEREYECKGYCHTHYCMLRKGKNPHIKIPSGPVPVDPTVRFWSKVDIGGPIPENCPELGNCWLWTGYLDKDGYGNFSLKIDKPVRAHLFSFEEKYGKIQKGMHLDHLCRVRNCIRPEHLEEVTPKENSLRGIGVGAINAAKTHCIRGHPLSGPNLGFQKRGRYCKKCASDRAMGRI